MSSSYAQEDTSCACYVRAKNLSLNSPRVKAYSGVDLAFSEHKACAICAENKSGKSELLLTLAGRMLPSSGECSVNGIDITQKRNLSRIRKIAGLSFFDNVNDVQMVLSVKTVVSAELGLYGKSAHGKALDAYLDTWGLSAVAKDNIEEIDRFTYDLLGIALGMCGDPEILVVDDIQTDLTEHQSLKLVSVLKYVARTYHTSVFCGVTDYDLAAEFDEAACITQDAKAQRLAYQRKHAMSGEVA